MFFLKTINWDYISNIMFTGYFIWDVIYIIQVIATYCYIFIKDKTRKELINRYRAQPNIRGHLKLPTPTALIVTYMFFYIPDLVIGLFQFGNIISSEFNFRIIAIAYKISWLAYPRVSKVC